MTLSPPARRALVAIGSALALAAVASGCGGASSAPAVVRVGGVKVDKATVDHWTHAIALGTVVPGTLGQSGETPRQRALGFLISANWAIGAAAEHGLSISGETVNGGLKERIAAVPNGRREFEEEIASTGQRLADVEFEVKAQLALVRLRNLLSRSVPPVTESQITNYYRRHPQSFRIPDRRWVDLIEAVHGYAHAVALGKELGPGRRFAKRALRELVPRQTPYEAAHRENHRLVQAIFAASPGRVAAPASFNNKWVLLVVRKLIPPSMKPLSQVSAQISERLSEERHAQALASFLQAYRREWRAKTHCKPGFIVQKCAEYRGRVVPEGNPLTAE